MPTDLPAVVWIAGLLVLFAVAAFLVYLLRDRGLRYGINFFLSAPFALLFIASTATYIGVALPFLIGNEVPMQAAQDNLVWGIAIFAACLVAAYLLNGLRSNFLFSLPYTTAQALVASLSALVLVFVLYRLSDNKKSSK